MKLKGELTRYWEVDCKLSSNEDLRQIIHEVGDMLVTKVRLQEIEYKGSIISKKSLTPKSLLRDELGQPQRGSCCSR